MGSYNPDSSPGEPVEPVDIVYTWVDDAFPGYGEIFARHARTKHDRNPNRTRDNLELLRYSLRSLERFAPWARRVHLVTMRPQVPHWLDPACVNVVHHDQLFEPRHLPTFNSFAIVSNLYKLPGLSRRFLYLEDDRLLLRSCEPVDFLTASGKLALHVDGSSTPAARQRTRSDVSPWNLALAASNHLLDQRYGACARPSIKRAPLFVDCAAFARFEHAFADALEATRASRFRAAGNVVSEHMYPYFLWHEGLAERLPAARVRRDVGYLGLENFAPYNALALAWLALKRPKLVCLNDNYGARPRASAVRVVSAFLARTFPVASRFERP
jgi:hypothetical protein